jgi:ferredoxin
MGKYKITHEREKCIGCGSCVAIAPLFWEMGGDNKSMLKRSRKVDKNFELEIDEKDFKSNMDAANACPVNVIHIIEKATNKKLI